MNNAEGIADHMKSVDLHTIQLDGEVFFKISNSDQMRSFFMSIVSDSNHWMFVSSNGGLTAGRKNADHALFPYYTDDKITEMAEITGSKSIFHIQKSSKTYLWEPFTNRNEHIFHYSRNLYKNKYGNKIIFEEVNHDLELSYRYKWSSSNEYGFVRESTLTNQSTEDLHIWLLDGLQNILPSGVPSDTQTKSSNLVEAYKRSELDTRCGLGIFALSAIIVDKPEPSEALKANIAWALGLENPTYLLSSLQLNNFRKNGSVKSEKDVKAEKGAYLLSQKIFLQKSEEKQWMIITNVNQDASQIEDLSYQITHANDLPQRIAADIALGTERLIQRVAASDGLQHTADSRRDTRHYSNTLFNIMRGGIFDHSYQIEKWDFSNYLSQANQSLAHEYRDMLAGWPEKFTYEELRRRTQSTEHPDLIRLSVEYLPLLFSRRHGDPSRPWNRFSINTRSEVDGSKVLDYEGNWRDIFQNWEALALSYPLFIEGMIFKFLNASTFDGYNPYRVTKGGFDWETIEPHDPWSYIGYWGDHQIIYLQKFLEIIENHYPGRLHDFFSQEIFVYAHVPYRIKNYEKILKNPKDTIVFDEPLDLKIRKSRKEMGADGALVRSSTGEIHRVSFIEKILATALAKMSNFIPEAGIWLNTQRPEWNDANNALVGNGVSMVTLYYMRRFFQFLQKITSKVSASETIPISVELYEFFNATLEVLATHRSLLQGSISNQQRRAIMDGLGKAGGTYRFQIYEQCFSGEKSTMHISDLITFCTYSLAYIDHAIQANKRNDGMYHAYNLITIEDSGDVSVGHLSEMLEGQVAVLSSGYLSPTGSLEVLDAMKKSKLFRPDQYSYLLYPYKKLPGFLERNHIPQKHFESSELLKKLQADANPVLAKKDVQGQYHFSGNFRNANDLKDALDTLEQTSYRELVQQERALILRIFEEVFDHKSFTGRSGTFYGYEGLGSIYWHMVSKLLLATQECALKAIDEGSSNELIGRHLAHFYEINEGIGVHKSPELYGAFPVDPYSHTPLGKGAQQPGMTGQVKEDILSRIGELGIYVQHGCIQFAPHLLRQAELLQEASTFEYIDINQQKATIQLPANALAFTYCQVPIIYQIATKETVEIVYQDGTQQHFSSLKLDQTASEQLFSRSEHLRCIRVHIPKIFLK